MKTKVFKFLTIAICAISLCGCKQTEGPTEIIVPHFIISGAITTEEGLPLEGIHVNVDTSNFALDLSLKRWQNTKGLSGTDGLYRFGYMCKTNTLRVEWPSEVTLIATDTAGIYATQTKTFPIEVLQTDAPKVTNGLVSDADFVMHKK